MFDYESKSFEAQGIKNSLYNHASQNSALFGPAEDMSDLLREATDLPLLLWGNRSHICRLWKLGQVNMSLWSFSGILWSCTGMDLESLNYAGYWVHFVSYLFRFWETSVSTLMVWILCRFSPFASENGLWSLKFWDCSRDCTSNLDVSIRAVKSNMSIYVIS